MWQHMFSMPVMRTVWKHELMPPHSTHIISCSCLNTGIMFKFWHSSVPRNDFIICSVITGQQLAQQWCAANH